MSVSLSLQADPFDDRKSRPFFAGLLPDGRMRRVIARQFHEFGRWAHLAVALSEQHTQLLTAKLVQGKTGYEPGLA